MKGKTILITGGSGFLGHQLTKDILKLSPKQIIIFSRNESKQAKMKNDFKDKRIRYVLGDVSDDRTTSKIMHDVDICIHAAAQKRIDSAEENPVEAVKTNIIGTINICEAALLHNIECLLYVSTDKAKAPETMYGSTKFCGEQIVRNYHRQRKGKKTKFKTVRYGNVIGSTGSVLTIWKQQHAKLDPITITSKEMTRFFMSVKEASDLVINTIKHGECDTEHSLPMKSVNIYNLAKYLYPNDKIKITGLKNNEKIHEQLYEGYNSKDHQVSPKEILT